MFIENLITVAIMYGLVLVSCIAYSTQGYLLNNKKIFQSFEFGKFFSGIGKKGLQGIIFALLTIIISFLPVALKRVNLELPDDVKQLFDIVVIVGVLGSLAIKNTLATIQKYIEMNKLTEEYIIKFNDIKVEDTSKEIPRG